MALLSPCTYAGTSPSKPTACVRPQVLNDYIRSTTKASPPADILSVIVRRRAMDAALAEAITPAADMRGLPYVSVPTVNLKAALVPKKGAKVAVLAEIKRFDYQTALQCHQASVS